MTLGADEQEAFRRSIRDFVCSRCKSEDLHEWEESGSYPAEVFADMARLGWTAIPFPDAVGGAGGSVVDMCILAEELARASYDIATGIGLTIFWGLAVTRHGTSDQVNRFVRPALSGEGRFAIAMTEPDAGSDAKGLRTVAERRQRGWVLNGQKVFTTGAHIPSTTLIVAARTGTAVSNEGISLFLVPNDADGLTIRRLRTLGRNIIGTNEIFLEDVRVGEDALLGAEGRGWETLRAGLQYERLYVAAALVGSARAMVDEALSYAKTREQFGRPIGSFQVIGHLLADMYTQVHAASLLVYDAAMATQAGTEARRSVSEAKLFASEVLKKVSTDAMQILGGYGYVTESSVQRHFRDAQAATITAGTSQIQRGVIARSLGLKVD